MNKLAKRAHLIKFTPAKKAAIAKRQAARLKEANKFERYLTGYISSRRFCELVGFGEEMNTLARIFQQLQDAHDELMNRGFREQLELIMCALKEGTITPKDATRMMGMDARAVYYLLSGEPM